jgi:Cdc6-like AAA superfamily ATPase
MLNLTEGNPIAKIINPKNKSSTLLYLNPENDSEIQNCIKNIKLEPRLNPYERSVSYIAGPSGSGKTTYALNLIRPYLELFPDKPFFLFSRTDYRDDPAFKNLKPMQIPINDSMLTHPIDITEELRGGSIVLFDDCNTLQDDKLKKAIEKLMNDILEVGRKLDITIIITSHLVIPNDKKMARTILNEMQSLTVFPKCGSSQQIRYCLKTYYGINNKQIDNILSLKSRWVTISKSYPNYVLYENGCFIL